MSASSPPIFTDPLPILCTFPRFEILFLFDEDLPLFFVFLTTA